jgi:hypothetical protein
LNLRKLFFLFLFLATFFSVFQYYNISQKSAIIIDSINDGQEFKTQSNLLLSQSGFQVKYVSGENVTVEFFKNLPEKNDLYIFRVHSTCINNRTWIFTGEKYRPESYPLLQLADLIHKAKPSLDSGYYFSVSPELIQQNNKNRFKDGAILMMGCEGLDSNDLAQVFCFEGASIYLSWDCYVCLEHTDQTFLALIDALYTRKLSISESIAYIILTIGNDPIYNSSLKYYPLEHGYLKVS